MVREIITINVGQAGIQLGQSIWQQYCSEHEMNSSGCVGSEASKDAASQGNGNIHCFFQESENGCYLARNLSVDLESNVIDDVKNSNIGSIFFNDFLLNGKEDAANNFARGRFSVGREMIDKVDHAIKKLYECCDNVQGMIMNHSVGGGTGSGLGALILENLNLNYAKKSKLGFEIYPSQTISTCVVEPYNAMLATSSLIDFTDISFVLDNEALYRIFKTKLNIEHPSYCNINHLLSKSISSLTASIRFEGELNLDMNDLRTNLVPFPKLHFMINSLAPVLTPHKMETFKSDARTLTDLCFEESSFFVEIPEFDCDDDKYMAALLMFRGNIVSKDATNATRWVKDNNKCSFVDWSPCGFKLCLNEMPLSTVAMENDNSEIGWSKSNAVMIGNNVGISRVFSNALTKKFDLMYSQRAFVHWYVGEGMEECEFEEARENLGYLEKDYLDIMNDANSPNSDSDDDSGDDGSDADDDDL